MMKSPTSTIVALCILASFHYTKAGTGHLGSATVFRGSSCNPDESLYTNQDPINEDLAEIDRETQALGLMIGKKDVARLSQTAGLFMHSYNLAVKATVDGKLGAMTKKLEGITDSTGKLARRLKSLKFVAAKFAPALGVLGAAFAIIAGEAFPDPNKEAIQQLEKQMHKGFNKLRQDMDRKYSELKNFVEDSVQHAQIANLKAQIEEISNYFTNCIEDEHAEECIRNAIRNIEANRFRFANMDLVPTQNATRLISRYELEMEFSRKFLLVSALSHVASLMTFDPEEDAAEIESFKYRLKRELGEFKVLVNRNIQQIKLLWTDVNTYHPLCLQTATRIADENGKAAWNLRVTVNDWSNCKAVGPRQDLNSVEAVCRQWKKRYQGWSFSSKVFRKLNTRWNAYKQKLFGDESIFTQLETMVNQEDNPFTEQMLNDLIGELDKNGERKNVVARPLVDEEDTDDKYSSGSGNVDED